MPRLRSIIRDFMANSTIHGLGPIARSKTKAERAIFVVSFLVCCGFLIYSCYQIVAQFVERPIATSYFIQEADTLFLPDITVCPFNRLNRHFLAEKNVSEELATYMEWSFFIISPKYGYVNFTINRDVARQKRLDAELDSLLERMNVTWEEFLERASLNCDNFISKCMHEYMEYNCCHNTSNIMTSFGRCFRIEGKQQNGAGFGMGQTLLLDLPFSKYSLSENMLFNDGILLKLTERHKGYEFDAIFIPPGVHALLQLRATKMEFMDIPSYRCRQSAEEDYAPLLCYYRCILQPVGEACKCRYVGLPPVNSTRELPVCKPGQVLRCAYRAIAEHLKKEPAFPGNCKMNCRPRCNYWQYHSTVSYAKYPSQAAVQNYFNGDPTVHASKLILEVYFEKLEFTTIKHYPSVTIDQFLADIGGQMSLWMGASILSVIHLLVFVAFCYFSKSPKRKRRLKKSDHGSILSQSPQNCNSQLLHCHNGEAVNSWQARYSNMEDYVFSEVPDYYFSLDKTADGTTV